MIALWRIPEYEIHPEPEQKSRGTLATLNDEIEGSPSDTFELNSGHRKRMGSLNPTGPKGLSLILDEREVSTSRVNVLFDLSS